MTVQQAKGLGDLIGKIMRKIKYDEPKIISMTAICNRLMDGDSHGYSARYVASHITDETLHFLYNYWLTHLDYFLNIRNQPRRVEGWHYFNCKDILNEFAMSQVQTLALTCCKYMRLLSYVLMERSGRRIYVNSQYTPFWYIKRGYPDNE